MRELEVLEGAFRRHWSLETCDTFDLSDWHSGNPARGQCGVTALVLHEILGGDLLVADVLLANGERQGVHYWNRLPGGREIDFTREQFGPDEIVQEPQVAPREQRVPRRLVERYELFRSAVLLDLGLQEPDLTLTWP